MSGDIFSKIEHIRTADEVVTQIESLILEGILRVGDRLPGERELSSRFDVSRPILRDALKILEARGLLQARHGGGTYVADVIGQVFTQPVMDLIGAHRKATADYLEYRYEIEGIAAEYAAKRATDDDKALLTTLIKRMKEEHKKDHFDEEAAIDVEFHNAVGARDKLLEQHVAIYEGVMNSDPIAAREAAHAHIAFVERSMAEAERTDDWSRVSKLRRVQRNTEPPIGK